MQGKGCRGGDTGEGMQGKACRGRDAGVGMQGRGCKGRNWKTKMDEEESKGKKISLIGITYPLKLCNHEWRNYSTGKED
jgi:hypothetical protein